MGNTSSSKSRSHQRSSKKSHRRAQTEIGNNQHLDAAPNYQKHRRKYDYKSPVASQTPDALMAATRKFSFDSRSIENDKLPRTASSMDDMHRMSVMSHSHSPRQPYPYPHSQQEPIANLALHRRSTLSSYRHRVDSKHGQTVGHDDDDEQAVLPDPSQIADFELDDEPEETHGPSRLLDVASDAQMSEPVPASPNSYQSIPLSAISPMYMSPSGHGVGVMHMPTNKLTVNSNAEVLHLMPSMHPSPTLSLPDEAAQTKQPTTPFMCVSSVTLTEDYDGAVPSDVEADRKEDDEKDGAAANGHEFGIEEHWSAAEAAAGDKHTNLSSISSSGSSSDAMPMKPQKLIKSHSGHGAITQKLTTTYASSPLYDLLSAGVRRVDPVSDVLNLRIHAKRTKLINLKTTHNTHARHLSSLTPNSVAVLQVSHSAPYHYLDDVYEHKEQRHRELRDHSNHTPHTLDSKSDDSHKQIHSDDEDLPLASLRQCQSDVVSAVPHSHHATGPPSPMLLSQSHSRSAMAMAMAGHDETDISDMRRLTLSRSVTLGPMPRHHGQLSDGDGDSEDDEDGGKSRKRVYVNSKLSKPKLREYRSKYRLGGGRALAAAATPNTFTLASSKHIQFNSLDSVTSVVDDAQKMRLFSKRSKTKSKSFKSSAVNKHVMRDDLDHDHDDAPPQLPRTSTGFFGKNKKAKHRAKSKKSKSDKVRKNEKSGNKTPQLQSQPHSKLRRKSGNGLIHHIRSRSLANISADKRSHHHHHHRQEVKTKPVDPEIISFQCVPLSKKTSKKTAMVSHELQNVQRLSNGKRIENGLIGVYMSHTLAMNAMRFWNSFIAVSSSSSKQTPPNQGTPFAETATVFFSHLMVNMSKHAQYGTKLLLNSTQNNRNGLVQAPVKYLDMIGFLLRLWARPNVDAYATLIAVGNLHKTSFDVRDKSAFYAMLDALHCTLVERFPRHYSVQLRYAFDVIVLKSILIMCDELDINIPNHEHDDDEQKMAACASDEPTDIKLHALQTLYFLHSMDECLVDAIGSIYLYHFLADNFCDEITKFLGLYNEFKHSNPSNHRWKYNLALKIYNECVSESAPHQINVPFATFRQIQSDIHEIKQQYDANVKTLNVSNDMFDVAFSQIKRLVSQNHWGNFKRTLRESLQQSHIA